MKEAERICGYTARIELVRRDAKITELQLFAFTDENIEGREVPMQCLPSMQRIEGTQDCRDLAADKSLRLCAVPIQPHAKVALLGVFDHEAVPHLIAIQLGEAIEDAKCSVLAGEELSEIGLAKPGGETVSDLDAHLARKAGCRRGRSKVDLAEATSTNEAIESVCAAGFRAVCGW
jgi:hypothetical protein